MFTKRTLIGIAAGTVIMGIGVAALVDSIGLQTVSDSEPIGVGEYRTYGISAPAGTAQSMTVTGEKFDLEMSSPGTGGLQIPLTEYRGVHALNWTHAEDGTTRIKIQNTGSAELGVAALLAVSTDPILFAYHLVVITAGVVIVGFSMGFSARRPKGF